MSPLPHVAFRTDKKSSFSSFLPPIFTQVQPKTVALQTPKQQGPEGRTKPAGIRLHCLTLLSGPGRKLDLFQPFSANLCLLLSVSVCLCLSLSCCPCLSVSVCLSLFLSLSVSAYCCLSLSVSVLLSLPVCLVCLCLSLSLCLCPSVCLSLSVSA